MKINLAKLVLAKLGKNTQLIWVGLSLAWYVASLFKKFLFEAIIIIVKVLIHRYQFFTKCLFIDTIFSKMFIGSYTFLLIVCRGGEDVYKYLWESGQRVYLFYIATSIHHSKMSCRWLIFVQFLAIRNSYLGVKTHSLSVQYCYFYPLW